VRAKSTESVIHIAIGRLTDDPLRLFNDDATVQGIA
jgi:hypothetical protein